MGKSASCLRIIPCAGGSTDTDHQGSKSKKGWSFRKRSSSARAVRNSVIAETPSPRRKENLEITNFENASDSIVSDKESALHQDEKKPQLASADSHVADPVTVSETEKLLAAVDSHATDTATVSSAEKPLDTADSVVNDAVTVPDSEEDKAAFAVDESIVILIQSAIRGFLARKEQIKHRSVVKLQAAVRGHLVRCRAIGALRCVQAIAKMQVLIRARYARLSLEVQAVVSNENGTRARKVSKLPKTKPEITYTSMDELLKNSFARLLLESSPKSKRIKIKCDPLRRDSSWVWLERWMSLASPGVVDNRTTGIEKEQEDKISVRDYRFHEENEIFSESKDNANSSTSVEDSKLTVIEETNPVSSQITKSNEDCLSASSVERQSPGAVGDLDLAESSSEIDSVEKRVNSNVDSQPEIYSGNVKPEIAARQSRKLETEVKPEEAIQMGTEDSNATRSVVMDCNLPAIAVESEIEKLVSVPESSNELVSVPNVVIKHDSVPQIFEAEELAPHSAEFDLNMEMAAATSGDDIIINHKEPSQQDISSVHVGESECGTELSITSTLDSPDRSEIGPSGVELERIDSKGAGSHKPEEAKAVKVEIKTESGSVEKERSAEYATAVHIGMEGKAVETKESNLQLQAETEEKTKPETGVSDLTTEPERDTERSHQATPEASPRSQVTFTESQGTPSSHVSVSTKPKRAKTEKSGSIKKRTILSTAKKSPLNSTNDSGGKSSAEKLPGDQKSVKRRTTFGSPKPDITGQEERRDSSTSSFRPSYMQPTESARAKANAGHSPQSSPDVADRDVFLRKRTSLSGAKDRQESPSLQRTSSQAQSGSKSNGSSPHERKWQR
uniref:DUF4005 domain-containing protein n=1 Tax=Kalanchoe fedtschenkoi TaxID=63787 RepID=A0A7N0V526_KALFE